MLLLDLSNFLHRSLSVMNEDSNLYSRDGKITTGLHLTISMINSELKKFNYNQSAIAMWDSSGIPLFRRKINSEYKYWKTPILPSDTPLDSIYYSSYNRMSEDEKSAFRETDKKFLDTYVWSRSVLHRDLLPNLGIKSIQIDNVEADDIIAFLVHKLVKNGFDEKITIISSDRDFTQLLIEDKVEIYNPIKKERLTESDFYKSYEDEDFNADTWRKIWLIHKAIIGDSSDNVIGFEGIGDTSAYKYAKQLVVEGKDFGSLERPPRSPKEAFERFNSEEGRKVVETNMKLINMSYFIENEPDHCESIVRGLRQSSLIEPNIEKAFEVLNKYELKKLLLVAEDIIDSNIAGNSDCIFEYLK